MKNNFQFKLRDPRAINLSIVSVILLNQYNNTYDRKIFGALTGLNGTLFFAIGIN